MTLLLSDEAVRQACDIAAMVKAVEETIRTESSGDTLVMPSRQNLAYGDTFLRVMPVIMGGTGVLGLKMFQGSVTRGVRYVVVLCELESAEILAILDGHYLTAARTGATSGVATNHLARAEASTVGVIGSGLEAETNLQAVCAVRSIDRVRVFSPREHRRVAFAERMSALLGIPVVPMDDPKKAVSGTDIVVVATNTGPQGPVAYCGEWMEAGQHIVSIGSTTTALRELDIETFRRVDQVCFDIPPASMLDESGDLVALAAEGLLDRPGTITLAELLSDKKPPERPSERRTLFKSVGAALQDMAGAVSIYEKALQLGVGVRVPMIADLKTFD
jgi:ornithine cyclodeaminase/alanine dehydrogenase